MKHIFKRDLKDIVRYIPIDLDNKKATHDIVEKIQGKIELLKHNPKNYWAIKGFSYSVKMK